MRISTPGCLAAVLLVACAPPEHSGAPQGPPDAGCPAGRVPGPLGTCVSDDASDAGPPRGCPPGTVFDVTTQTCGPKPACENTCVSDADCPAGARCVMDEAGCTTCQPTGCTGEKCHANAECCDGS